MINAELFADGQLLDFKSARSLPFSIKRQADKFMDLIGASGSSIDNAAQSITLPASKNNIKAISSKDSFDFFAKVNGELVFSGEALKSQVTKGCKFPESYQIKLIGDGAPFYNAIDSELLSDLPIGNQKWDWDNIITSWTETYQDGQLGVWAPVVYGQTSQNSGLANGNDLGAWGVEDFRLHVYYKRIIDAIAQKYGYTFKSDFFDTWLFQEMVYINGIGDDFDITAGTPFCEVEALVASSIFSGGVLTFTTEIQDSCSEFEANTGELTVAFDDTYNIQIEATTDTSITSIEIWSNFTVVGQALPTLVNGVHEFDFNKNFDFNSGDVITLRPQGTGNIQLVFRSKGSETLYNNTTFEVGSVLHKNPIKDFLKGISHQFDLAWYVDDLCKVICVEPRFDYVLTDGQGVKTKHKGFYHSLNAYLTDNNIKPPTDICLDCSNYTITYECKFGQSITLSYKEDNDDPLAEYNYDLNNKDIPVYSSSTNLSSKSNKGKKVENPYFHDLFQFRHNSIFGSTQLPTVAKDWEIGEDLPIEEIDYSINPKCGLVYRGNATIRINRTGTSERVNAPWISQQANSIAPNGAPIDKQISVSYSDTNPRTGGLPARTYKGLTSTFYYQWLAIIRNGEVLKGNFNIDFCTVANIDFRNLNKIYSCDKIDHWILMCINGFKPTEISTTKLELIKYVCPTDQDVSLTEHWDLI